MRIQILIDIKDSFFHKYIDQLKNNIKPLKHRIKIINSHRKIKKGDVLFLISCKTILNKQILTKNSKNVVIHPSKLPLGRGSAAVAWRVLENKKKNVQKQVLRVKENKQKRSENIKKLGKR